MDFQHNKESVACALINAGPIHTPYLLEQNCFRSTCGAEFQPLRRSVLSDCLLLFYAILHGFKNILLSDSQYILIMEFLTDLPFYLNI